MPLTLVEAGVAGQLTEDVKQYMAGTVFKMPIVQMGIEPRPVRSPQDVRDILDLTINYPPV
jgi:hypothetical protein